MQRMSDIVNAARRRVESLSPQQVANELSCGADLLLVDVREADELDATGRIDRAVHVPHAACSSSARGPHPSSCGRRAATRTTCDPVLRERRPSALAAAALQDIGYERVAHLDGGLRAWRDSGFATTSDVELVAEDDRSARPDRVPPPARVGRTRRGIGDRINRRRSRGDRRARRTRDWHPPSRRRRQADSPTRSSPASASTRTTRHEESTRPPACQ